MVKSRRRRRRQDFLNNEAAVREELDVVVTVPFASIFDYRKTQGAREPALFPFETKDGITAVRISPREGSNFQYSDRQFN